MLTFKVEPPVSVPLHKKGLIDADQAQALCRTRSGVWAKAGCYIFAVPRKRVAGWIPIYVGKAGASLGTECLTADKITKVNDYLLDRPAKEVRLYLIAHPTQRGRPNGRAIDDMEGFLISLAVEMNPGLINKNRTHPHEWGIAGVVRGGRGKPSAAAIEVRELLGFDDGRPG
jgi:hypothetical protein